MRIVAVVLAISLMLGLSAYQHRFLINRQEYKERETAWAYKQKYERYDQDYKRYKLGDLIPCRPRLSEDDHPSYGVPASRFYVWVVGPYSPHFCDAEECGPGGDDAEALGGVVAGIGEHEAGVPVELADSYILVADKQARIIGIYPRCTTMDLPDILAQHPDTGADATRVIPLRLAWSARCRPDLGHRGRSTRELISDAFLDRAYPAFSSRYR